MKTVWTFGDSFTFGHGCREDCTSGIYERYVKYRKPGDDIWTNKLAALFNAKINNLGVNGYCNNLIIDSIIDHYDQIQEGDVVVIGKTSHARNHIPVNDSLYTIIGTNELTKTHTELSTEIKNLDQEISQAIINYQYFFANHEYYKKQQDRRFNFIKNRLYTEKKVSSCIIWDVEVRKNFSTILKDTRGKIVDYHFSWKGHSEFTKFIHSRIVQTLL